MKELKEVTRLHRRGHRRTAVIRRSAVVIKSYSIYMRTFSEYASKLYKEGRTWGPGGQKSRNRSLNERGSGKRWRRPREDSEQEGRAAAGQGRGTSDL